MKTLNLQEAATLLGLTPEGLRRKAVKGEIPGAKVGKWRFIEEDLVSYIRSKYTRSNNNSLESKRGDPICHYKNEATFGGLDLLTMEKEYKNLLVRKIK